MIIEDEVATRTEIAKLLSSNNYTPLVLGDFENIITAEPNFANALAKSGNVTTKHDATHSPAKVSIIDRVIAAQPDLILLDINLPGISGRTLLKHLRAESNIPVIILTSQNSEMNEALAISFGADDFIAKPFNPEILLLRIGAVLKRTHPQHSYNPIQKFHHLTFNAAKGTLEIASSTLPTTNDAPENSKVTPSSITLTKTEILIFAHLLSHQNQIVTRQELMTLLWHNASFLNDNTLTVNISRLRDKLAKVGLTDAIETRKGMGYILK